VLLSTENITLLNESCGVKCDKFKGMHTAMVRQTDLAVDSSQPWQIALQSPNTSLVFSGFTDVAAGVPFDHNHPPATIKAQAKLVHDKKPKGYPRGMVPDGPIPASMTNGSMFEVVLVPLAHSNALRMTVLPVMA
jgi:hypothetical protein